MPYKRSSHRLDFEVRVGALRASAKAAERSPVAATFKHMIFQCAIFQTSAAIEDYLRLLIETWVFQLRQHDLGKHVPVAARGFVAVMTLEGKFSSYSYTQDESSIASAIGAETDLWNFLLGTDRPPPIFSGKLFHDGTTYPSYKNLKRLLRRVGIEDPKKKLNSVLKSDAETLIEAFQSIRTAIAHSAPPALTLNDVIARISDMMRLIGVIDRIMYKHVIAHGGLICWT